MSTQLLRSGARGRVVAELQAKLLDLGYAPGPADGIFGRRTKAAVKAFQAANGLTVDGIVGEQTATALQWTELLGVVHGGLDSVADWVGDWWGDGDSDTDDDDVVPSEPAGSSDAPGTTTLRSVRVWFNAFIPYPMVLSPGPTDIAGGSNTWFHGDSRSFSTDRYASSRFHSEVLVFDLYGEHPDIEQEHWCGETIEYEDRDDGSTAEVDRLTAGTEGLQFYGLTYSGAEPVDPIAGYQPKIGDTPLVTLYYSASVANPLRVSPDIDMWATLQFDRNEGTLHVEGAVDDYPAFEGYAMKNDDGRVLSIFAHEAGDSPVALAGGANRPFESTLSLGSSG